MAGGQIRLTDTLHPLSKGLARTSRGRVQAHCGLYTAPQHKVRRRRLGRQEANVDAQTPPLALQLLQLHLRVSLRFSQTLVGGEGDAGTRQARWEVFLRQHHPLQQRLQLRIQTAAAVTSTAAGDRRQGGQRQREGR